MKKLLLMVLVATLVASNCMACGSFLEDRDNVENIGEKDKDDNYKVEEDGDTEKNEESIAGDTDEYDVRSYAEIIQGIRVENNMVSSINNQENALKLVSAAVQQSWGETKSIDMKDIDATTKDQFNYSLLYKAGMGNDIPRTGNEPAHEFGTPYNNDILNECLAAYYEGGSIEITDYSGFRVVDENHTLLMPADGDWGITYESYKTYQDGDYVLFEVPCYDWPHWGLGKYRYTLSVLLKETDSEISAYQIVRVETVYESVSVSGVSVSSHLPNSSGKTYVGENLIDGKLETAWAENANGVGVGETIELDLGEEQEVNEISIFNGYQATYKLHAQNGQVSKIRMEFDNGYTKEVELEFTDFYDDSDYEIAEMAQPVRIAFDEPIITTKIKITILRAVAGTAYEDTCISEIYIR